MNDPNERTTANGETVTDTPPQPGKNLPDGKPTEAEMRMRDALGPELGSDVVEVAAQVAAPRRSVLPVVLIAIAGIIALQVAAALFFPPTGPGGTPYQYPAGGMVGANIELPAPEVFYDPTPETPRDTGLVTFDVTVSNTLFTGWIVMVVIAVVGFLLSRGIKVVPSGPQNALEYVYEGLANFATSLGGPQARRYVPIFAALFLFILLSNWSGLIPPVGRVHALRAPTSDVNTTVGLALFSFFLFHAEGVRVLGPRRYLGKFFSLRAFRTEGFTAGLIALFVGVIEFLLEFIKPVTLAMRLFGNIYGGEVALGVITGLTIAIVPAVMVGLEFMLNFMQALIFSVLTLMFTIIAIESHDDHAEHDVPEGNIAPDMSGAHAAPAH
ncbi:MAG TPA: F0F1 ATP synthase subunit A [Candidatus Limnocylindria bacterium]|nr:F0F1 ATP synthase subunit A [Candidatus Limnocylindria bacterium]